MAKEKWLDVSSEQLGELHSLADAIPDKPGYRVIRQDQIPAVFRPGLQAKCDSAVVMASGTPAGSVIFVCNALRVHQKDSHIDQEPFGIALLENGVASGLFVHHGRWDGRTNPNLPNEFWNAVQASGIGNYFPLGHVPPKESGPLSELSQTSHLYAFDNLVRRLGAKGQTGCDESEMK